MNSPAKPNPQPLPRLTGNEAAGAELARAFRAKFDLGHAPIKDVFELVHTALGVDVMSMDTSPDEHGLSMINSTNDALVIAVATTPHPMRLRSTVAHEVGHVVAGDLFTGVGLVPGERSPEEIRADAFSRHLLIPFDGLLARLELAERRSSGQEPSVVTEADLSALVQEFEVSPAIAAVQLKMLRLIGEHECQVWRSVSAKTLAVRYGWLSQYQSLVRDAQQPRGPQTLLAVSVEAIRGDSLGLTEVARWYEEDVSVLREQLADAGIDDYAGTTIATAATRRDGTSSEAPTDDVPAPDDGWDDDAPLFPPSSPAAEPDAGS
ncbi:ImmA/IrrE family metallo-endopeptidase [Angustibacter sp. McL0619]|uniref:ImmA/IrrE family metallo-endopeptidase n=1 Tax=Angustibacter sp. McL0619 TaxID=3415676 RepID=UPI003CF80DAE